MTDREFLRWVHERLEFVYDENPGSDFMRRLRSIVLATPSDCISNQDSLCLDSYELFQATGSSFAGGTVHG